MKGIKHKYQLMERCDGHDHGGGGGLLGSLEGETVVRRCDSSQGGVKVVRNWFQLMERGRCKGLWEGVTVVRNCDSPQ